MTSADNNILVLMLNQLSDMKRDNASYYERTERQLSEMRRENAEFRREMRKEFQDFEARQDAKIETLTKRQDARFDRLEAQVSVMQNDITGLKHDVSNLYTWNYWTLSIILALAAMPHIISGVKSLIGAIAEGVSAVIGVFMKGSK